MGQKHQSTDSIADQKKRRRVGFAESDVGIEANHCIKIFLVGSKEEVEAGTGYAVDPVDLNQFFEDTDGKIYGYQGLKISIWVSSVSFHSHVSITYESKSDGGKGITDLKAALQNIFGEGIIEDKAQFLQTFSTESQYISSVISSGERQQLNASIASNGHLNANASKLEVIRLVLGNMPVGHLYSRLVPLVLLLVDGSSPIDVTDSSWELFLLVQEKSDEGESCQATLLGFAACYRFYRYPDSNRLRLSQILVLPPFQRKGYGHSLMEVITNVAVSENVYDLTIEEPLDSLQHIRNCIDVSRLLSCSSVQNAVDAVVSQLKEVKLCKRTQTSQFLPPSSVIEDVRKTLKINKKQLFQCWEILIYIALDPIDKYMKNYRTFITDRVKSSIIGKDSGTAGKRVIDVPSDYEPEMSFVMCKSTNGEGENVEVDENQTNQEEQLQQLVDERIKDIKSVAQKVSLKA